MLDAELRDAQMGLVLASVLDDIERLLTRYVVFRSPAQVCAVALWVVHAHTLRAVDVTPYLHVRSAEKGAGKTRLLEVLHELVPRPWHAVQPTEAVLFRRIHRDTPTLLLDETDRFFSKNGSTERAEAVRSILNAGYRRGATVDRVNLKAKDPLQPYRVFCAKAFAGIGTLPGTVGDRSIPIELARRKKTEPVARFFLRDAAPDLHRVRVALAAWGEDAVDVLRDARPALPEALPDRAAEVWEPLLAIADLAGGEWPARARKAALELHQGRTDTDSVGVALLRAIRDVFNEQDRDRLLTLELLKALIEREAEPWPSWWGKEVDRAAADGEVPRKPAVDLARLLRPFHILPKDIRIDGGKGKGYARADFEDAFLRYLGASEGDTETTPAAQGFEVSRKPHGEHRSETLETLGRQAVSPCLGGNGPGDGEPRESSRLDARPPGRPCSTCAAVAWYRAGDGWSCGVCHPSPASSADNDAEWLP